MGFDYDECHEEDGTPQEVFIEPEAPPSGFSATLLGWLKPASPQRIPILPRKPKGRPVLFSDKLAVFQEDPQAGDVRALLVGSWGEPAHGVLRLSKSPITNLHLLNDRAPVEEIRDRLLTAGYEQVSMRMFRRAGVAVDAGPAYCCQRDGMVGIGCGARSYTGSLHYSSEYAVGRPSVREIIADYILPERNHGLAAHGFRLSRMEQARRFVLVSLLQVQGLSMADYHAQFHGNPEEDVPEILPLADRGLVTQEGGVWRLTEAGLERSDAIGPFLYSDCVRDLSEAYQWT